MIPDRASSDTIVVSLLIMFDINPVIESIPMQADSEMPQRFLLKLIRASTGYKEVFSGFPLGYFIIKRISKAIAEVLLFTRLKRINRAEDFFRGFSCKRHWLRAFLVFIGPETLVYVRRLFLFLLILLYAEAVFFFFNI